MLVAVMVDVVMYSRSLGGLLAGLWHMCAGCRVMPRYSAQAVEPFMCGTQRLYSRTERFERCMACATHSYDEIITRFTSAGLKSSSQP